MKCKKTALVFMPKQSQEEGDLMHRSFQEAGVGPVCCSEGRWLSLRWRWVLREGSSSQVLYSNGGGLGTDSCIFH